MSFSAELYLNTRTYDFDSHFLSMFKIQLTWVCPENVCLHWCLSWASLSYRITVSYRDSRHRLNCLLTHITMKFTNMKLDVSHHSTLLPVPVMVAL